MFTVRDARPEDAPALALVFSDPDVVANTFRRPERAEADARRFTEPAEPGARRLVAVSPEGEVAAFLALLRHGPEAARHAAEFFVVTHPLWRGRGAARLLVREALGTAFADWGLARVELEVNADNARAIRLYESLGFVREGVKRASYSRDGRLVDSVVMGLLREEWRP